MTAAYVEDTDRLGLGRPDAEPKATETVDGIVELIADADRLRPRLRVGRRRLLPRPQLPRLRQALQPPPRGHGPGRGGGLGEPQGGAPRLRPLEGDQGGRGHELGFALGPGSPRLAHRVLGDGRAGARRLLRRPRRRLRPGLPPPRERDRPVRVGGPPLRPRLDAQRDGRRGGARRCRNRRATSSS